MRPSTFRRWILPWCALAAGLGALVGAVHYRSAAPVAAVTAPSVVTSTVTSVVEAEPVVNTVTVTAAPRVETVVLRPQAAAETRTVTVRPSATPKQRETLTETVTATPQTIVNVGNGEQKERGNS